MAYPYTYKTPETRPPIQKIAVYCGSASGNLAIYTDSAKRLGERMAQKQIQLIYGGGGIGLMQTIAEAVLGHGGAVIGVIPEPMVRQKLVHPSLTQTYVVQTMHERKAKMAELADAFIAMPGGYGTWEEILEAITWNQLGIHHKPCGILNTGGYYDPLLAQLDRAEHDGFMRSECRQLVLSDAVPESLLERILAAVPTCSTLWHG
ncbi:MAG: TIGR00730 family Rossman fold protein [Thermoguttaceae bacterium]|nr:TIGR00730 family Rossman fold protein [Thermoguttaceae bacterium]